MRAPSASLGQYCRSRGSDIRFKAADGKSASAASEAATGAGLDGIISDDPRSMPFDGFCRTLSALALLAGLLAQTGDSLAGWREDMKTFRIGMIAEPGAGQTVTGLAALKQAYAQALGIPVEIFVARDYAALIDAQATARVDYALYSTTAYATAALLCACVEPVAAPVSDDGATGIKAILVTRDGRLSERLRHRHASGRHRRARQHCRLRAAAARTRRPGSRIDRIGAVPGACRKRLRRRGDAGRRIGRCDFRLAAGQCRRRASGRHAAAAGRCRPGQGVAVGGVEIVAAQIRPARSALRASTPICARRS